MVSIVSGKGVGSGKSYLICEMLIHHFRCGGSAFVSSSFRIKWPNMKAHVLRRHGLHLEDDQFRTIEGADIKRLHEATAGGTDESPVLIVVEEAQDHVNARDWGDKSKRPLFDWLCQSRHDCNDVIFVTQHANNIDKQIRRLATFTWSIRNLNEFPIPGLGKMGSLLRGAVALGTLGLVKFHGICFARTLLDFDGRTELEKKFLVADRGIFDCYESKSMRGSRPRLGQPIAKKQLKQDKSKMLKMRLLVPLAILGFAYGCYHVYKHGIIPGSVKPKATASEKNSPLTSPAAMSDRPKSPQSAPQDEGYELVSDKMVSVGRTWLKTQNNGFFELGEMSLLGMTEAIRGRTAKVRKPNGKILYVVAGDWTPPAREIHAQEKKQPGLITIATTPPPTLVAKPERGW